MTDFRTLIRQNSFLRFIFTAGIIYLFLFFVYQFVVKKHSLYDQKFIGSIIQCADFVVRSMGYQTFTRLQDLDLQVIGIDGGTGVWIGSNCNGITLFSLFSVFIVAYPGNLYSKFWFIPAGILCIHLLNILRVVGLLFINRYAPGQLDFNHTYTFTFIMYAFIFGMWVFWINRFSQNNDFKSEKG